MDNDLIAPGTAPGMPHTAGGKSSKKKWINEWIDGLEHGGHTGQVQLTLHFNRGGITRVIPMLEVAAHHLGG